MEVVQPTFEEAFRAEYAGLVRVLSPIVGSVADAEAVAQDSFLKAFTRWKRIGRYDRPGAWIQRVAIRDAIRFAERGRRRPPPAGRSTDLAESASQRVDLDRAMAQLTPRQRACTLLHHVAGWPVSEVAEALGCSEATVRVHIHRARVALAALLELDREETRREA